MAVSERLKELEASPADFVPSTPDELTRALANPMYRLNNLYFITTKEESGEDGGLVVKFRMNDAQRQLAENLWYRNIVPKARQRGICVDPNTRVLTAFCRWVRIADLKPGEKIVAVDEHVPGGRGIGRRMRTAVVEAVREVYRKAYRITFDDGRSVVCTDRHPWLTRKVATDAKWRTISGKGNDVVSGKITVGTKVRWITKPWSDDLTYEDGWMGGLIDGEGSISNGNRAGASISISQVEGPTFARMEMYLSQRGYNYRTEIDRRKKGEKSKLGNESVHKLCLTRMDEIFRLIGQTQPSRFAGRPFWEGKELPGSKTGIGWATVTSIEELGEQAMIDLQTSTGTFIAEGFVSHNTTFACILALDYAIFTPNFQAGIIAHTDGAAKKIFRDKVLFAYERLPDQIKEAMPLKKQSAEELVFANDSSILVSTSMRGGTTQFLHISEFGKICARFPHRAREIVTGSLPAVPLSGIAIIESTAEGRDGDFYRMTMRAKGHQDQGKRLTKKDFRLHFFSWWDADEYQMDPRGVIVTEKDHDYFDEVESKIGRRISIRQRAWYCATRDEDFSGDQDKMFQEYPSCVSGDTYVSTPNGMVRIKDLEVDGSRILAKFDQGIKPAFKVETSLGYTLTCTEDHRILCPDGEYRELRDLSVGDALQLGRPEFGQDYEQVTYWPNNFGPSTILIDEDLALFIGIYMGDGCFTSNTVSIACTAEDDEMIRSTCELLTRYIAPPIGRYVGDKKGGYELRASSVAAREPLFALGLVKVRENSAGYTRNIHVPDYIMRSPRAVVAAFLRGIFETDGFACRKGLSVKMFSKHEGFVKDVQLLLLGFGIESRVSRHVKRGGAGGQYEYVGYELALRSNGVRSFATQIGFMSKRKQERAEVSLSKRKTGKPITFDWTDTIASIEPVGSIPVFDIMTDTHQFNAAGIEVHNCVEEAFMVSSEGCYFTNQLAAARKQKRICESLPVADGVPCWTFWDIGNSDGTAIWVIQKIGPEFRCIRFYEAWGEPYSHAAQWLQSLGLTWDTMYLPHDADHVRQGQRSNKSPKQMLEELMPGVRFEIVPRIDDINWGIQQTRNVFPMLWFDETECKKGIVHLENYRKKWSDRQQCWGSQPDKAGGHSEAADAIRQFAQAYEGGLLNLYRSASSRRRSNNWRTV